MKIAFLSDAVYPYHKGGKETRLFAVSTRLAKRGHTVSIYSMKWWKGKEKIQRVAGVSLVAISPFFPLYSGQRRSIRQALLFAVYAFGLLFHDFDVLDADQMPYFPLITAKIVCLLKRKRLIVTWNEVWGYLYWKSYLGVWGWVAAVVERLSLFLPHAIVAISNETARKLFTLTGKNKVYVVPNGADVRHIQSIAPAVQMYDCLYAGRVLTHKHIEILVLAIEILKKTRPQVTCLIIGEGPARERVQKLITDLNLNDQITLLPFYETVDQVYAHMKASRVLVLPSTREGFGLVALEANASGIPFVTSDSLNNAAKELINGKNGMSVSLTAADFAGAIEKYLKQPKGELQKACIKSARRFDWEKVVTSLEEIYGGGLKTI